MLNNKIKAGTFVICVALIIGSNMSCSKENIIGIGQTQGALDSLDICRFINQFSRYHKAWENQRLYEAWPMGQLFYDPNTQKVCQVYCARDKHVDLGQGDVYFRCKDEYGEWSQPVLIATWANNKRSKRCHGAGICTNGNYIALILEDDTIFSNCATVNLYRSLDHGSSWISEGEVSLDSHPIRVSESSCVFKTISGRLLSYASVGLANYYIDPNEKKNAYCIYSDDNGHTWNYSVMPDGMGLLEGTFVQVAPNIIYCIARRDDSYYKECTPQMAVSYDNGESWSYLSETDIKCVDAPVAQLLVDNYVYLLCGDRWLDEEGCMSLRMYILSIDDYTSDKIAKFTEHEYFISKIIIPVGCFFGDFSYPALVETPHTVQGTFYYTNGNEVGIYEMIAEKIRFQ